MSQRSFMRVPDLHADARLAILGVPFEGGTHPIRVGARLGPEAVRRQSLLLNPFDIDDDRNALDAVALCDAGDVPIWHDDVPRSIDSVERAVSDLLARNVAMITIGGDGIVTLPQIRALHKHHRDLAVIHIDAHTDAYPGPGMIGATAFTRAAEEKALDVAHSFHVGVRGPVRVPGLFDFARNLGYRIITMPELRAAGIEATAATIKQHVGSRPVYLCYDVDFFDPTVAPGVVTPVCDGALPHEGLALLRALEGLHFVHFDINNVTPAYDVSGATALLAAHIAWLCVGIFSRITAGSEGS